MKKILIASVCAFSLCLTSCASKKAPETESKNQPPQTEIEISSEEENQEKTEENAAGVSEEENAEEELTAGSENSELQEDSVSSENFPEPEPELIEEPEIITLEAPDEAEVSEDISEAVAEEVENEEPPLITETEVSDAGEVQNATEENNEDADIEVTGPSDSDDDGITAIGGGIDITDDDSASEEKYSEKAEDITPSRSVTLKKFEYLDITYPGTGWIYMGLIDNSKDLAYFGRKLGTKDTKFSLQARAAGTKIVHFYRNDPLTGKYLDDYIEIIILAENGSNKTHIEAPEYKLPVEKKETASKKKQESSESTENTEAVETKEEKTESKAAQTSETSKNTTAAKSISASTTSTASTASTKAAATSASTASSTTTTESSATETSEAVTSTTTTSDSSASVTTDSASLLKEAQLLYNEKEYKAALNKLNLFFEYSTDNRDEALYLKGQILEAKSDVRDIKGAIDAYTSLTKNYPASKLWDSANKRIIYLKRFYLEVR